MNVALYVTSPLQNTDKVNANDVHDFYPNKTLCIYRLDTVVASVCAGYKYKNKFLL